MLGKSPVARRPASLALRVTALVGLATTAMFLLFAWGIERSIERHFAELDLGQLREEVQSLRAALGNGTGANLDALARRLSNASELTPLVFRVIDARGSTVSGTAPPSLVSAIAGQASSTRLDIGALHIWRAAGHTWRGALLRMKSRTLLVATVIDFHRHYLATLRRTLWLGTAVASALSVLLAWLAVQRGHAPIRRISARMREVTSEHLDVRLDPARVPIELTVLVSSFNTMIERIEESFRRLSNFSADIAHELRTPVSNLTTQTQVALSRARGSEDYRETLYSNLEEYERMGAMIGDMLFLARADHRLVRPERSEVDLAAEVRTLFEYFEAWAEDRGVALALRGEALIIRGDRSMLRRALSNLIANAVRHTERGQAVIVLLSNTGKGVRVEVENPGPEIPPEHLPRLFERFYRVDPSRQRDGEGAGLGLAIVKSIAEMHGGTVGVESAAGRTRFWMLMS